MRGLGLFVGKRSKTWYFQKDVGGRTKRILVGRWPAISAQVARQTAMGYAPEWGRGARKRIAFEAPTLQDAMERYLARPKLRSEAHKLGLRQQFERHLGDWLHMPLDEITKAMVVQRHAALAKIPSTANHLWTYFRTVDNLARRTHDQPENPAMVVEWFDEKGSGAIIEDLAAWRRAMSRVSSDQLLNPPLVARAVPVIHRAAFLARKQMTSAISSGCPGRPSGVAASIAVRMSSAAAPRNISVSVGPGATAFTRMPFDPSSTANARVTASSLAFVAE